ncbi:protein HOMOLOG OF MAMMALIAN LYST-INTERACTING PROTEIN 5 isoform X2 [Rhodamnia argentea]|uniref:Protein HOMOLOG OF MAMMALIAN LYST-INTERACTING PROTEIN 5 isoform X2 n=1 Tax=Rhodamnia argentea TaxID=178133 RepID=A0ABM3GZX6_9MYRT|nr:protein HOMOLOG OF MAMMALIAN LYST-INTERACTING PROTEIN 5 isoform X2 [Rhodamnia argentea]
MASEHEHEPAKVLLPYLQRADELQKHEPVVAYYCRLYAMDRGLRIPQSERTKTTNALLSSLIKQLEKDKKSLTLGPEDNLYLEGFALNVFGKADKQDRAGRADLNTAKTFYAASIFFEILSQFGPLQPDLEQKQKYAAWKAADIRKALKEGRKPVPGPPSGDDDLSIPSSTPSGSYDLGPSESTFSNAGPEADSSPQVHDKLDHQHHHSAGIPPSSSSYSSASYPSHDFQPPSPPITRAASSTYSSYSPPNYPQESSHPPPNYPQESSHPPPNYPQESSHPPPNYAQESSHPSLNRPSDVKHHLPHSYPSDQLPQIPHNYPSEPQQNIPLTYLSESQHHLPNSYPSQETPVYSYPHFQSYPSFTESNLSSVPSQYSSHYQSHDVSYPPQSDHQTSKSYASTAQYGAGNRNGTTPEAPPAETYKYDSNYQPPPEKIAEAHKAARFAVGALAFDDVSIAVDYLRKSLELLTNPSAGQ